MIVSLCLSFSSCRMIPDYRQTVNLVSTAAARGTWYVGVIIASIVGLGGSGCGLSANLNSKINNNKRKVAL